MDIYIDGKKMNGIKVVDSRFEKSEESTNLSYVNKEMSMTLSNVETNIRTLSDKTRLWCKQIRWNKKIYW